MTDPDWEPVMKRAAAIVTNRGGRTCHAAIIARELGVPAVVGTGNALDKIVDGQEVTISCAEGDTGFIYEGVLGFERITADLDSMPPAPLKIMCNPTQDGGSIDNAANYNSGLDVHYSSGVYNKAFCTLAKTAGWDTVKAFKSFARANSLYWTPSSTFVSGACGVETAATDLGFTKADVTAAFAAVGVSCTGGGGGGGTPTVLTNGVAVTGISGASGSDKLYTLDVPSGATGLKFVTSGGSGDADLYVKFGSAPTTTSYTCKSEGSTTAETCSIATAQVGKYYVLVHGYTTYSGTSLTGSYSTGGGGGGGGTVLTSGVPVTLASQATGTTSANYTLVVPAGKTSVVFTISGGTGDADMRCAQ